MKRKIFLLLGCTQLSLVSIAQTKTEILEYFREVVKENKLIVGQHCRDGELIVDGGYNDLVVELKNQSGRYVSLIGADFGWLADVDMLRIAEKLKEHAARGGLITVNWHAMNPWTGSGVRDMNIGGYDKDELNDLYTPGNPAFNAWRKDLDKVAEALQDLRNNGIVVLWRPLHEMNGDWFWWCARDKDQYTRLWRDIYNYLTSEKKLDNLIWIYSPNAVVPSSKLKNVMYYYPGDEYVDLVGEDIYNDTPSTTGFEEFSRLAPDKQYVVGEFGSRNKRGSLDNRVVIDAFKGKAAYYLQWHGWRNNPVAIIENPFANELMNHEDILTLDELKIKK